MIIKLIFRAHCRYQYSVQKFTYDQIMAAAKDVNILDGTEESHVSKEKPELKSA